MQPWSISETYYGTEDKKPVAEFVKEVDKYEGLLETMLGIEGLGLWSWYSCLWSHCFR